MDLKCGVYRVRYFQQFCSCNWQPEEDMQNLLEELGLSSKF